jgi:hypothetical protein
MWYNWNCFEKSKEGNMNNRKPNTKTEKTFIVSFTKANQYNSEGDCTCMRKARQFGADATLGEIVKWVTDTAGDKGGEYNILTNPQICGISKNPDEAASLMATDIMDCGLSVRSRNALATTFNVETVADLLKLNPKELIKARNCGRKSVDEILAFVSDNGLSFEENE